MTKAYLHVMDIRNVIKDVVKESQEPKEYRWIYFVLTGDTGKTQAYDVFAKQGDILLGKAKWFASWRKYAFFPQGGTVFEKDCLNDIASFLDDLMNARRGLIKALVS